MIARRPRLLLWLLSLSCILWMAGAASVGPVAARGIGTGSLPAPVAAAPIHHANAAKIAFRVVAATRLTIATVPPVPAPSAAARANAASSALRLTPYTPVVTGGSQSFDAGTLAGLAIKFLIVIGLLFIVLRVLKAILPKMQGGGKGGVGALVLHSESIGDKQRIVLLDLHGQLVAVGISGGAISPLATIDQPEAMESLRARYSSIPQAVPGYRESTKQPAIGQSFAEALKRAGIVGQHQTGAPPVPRVALTIPFLQRAAASREPGKVKAAAPRPIRKPRRQAAGQSEPEPVLLDALEAMRSLRQKVESS
ncbi:MAG TPA: flagellar biosynthetic protein FliO [Chloroflexota bacterium]|nr:flagellar biosynthetic protein FliO [Chloroflexota bacterium]